MITIPTNRLFFEFTSTSCPSPLLEEEIESVIEDNLQKIGQFLCSRTLTLIGKKVNYLTGEEKKSSVVQKITNLVIWIITFPIQFISCAIGFIALFYSQSHQKQFEVLAKGFLSKSITTEPVISLTPNSEEISPFKEPARPIAGHPTADTGKKLISDLIDFRSIKELTSSGPGLNDKMAVHIIKPLEKGSAFHPKSVSHLEAEISRLPYGKT